jgi:hypothetical protein
MPREKFRLPAPHRARRVRRFLQQARRRLILAKTSASSSSLDASTWTRMTAVGAPMTDLNIENFKLSAEVDDEV